MQSSPRRIVLGIAGAMFETEDEERLSVLADEVLAFASAASFTTRLTLRAALWLLAVAPLILFVSWRPLVRLDRARRHEVLARIERSPMRLALLAWRTLLVLHFYEDARELALVGYREERKRHLTVIPVPATSGVRLREDLGDVEDRDDAEEEKGAA